MFVRTALLFSLLCLSAFSQTGFVHADGKGIVGPKGEKLLLRGINLGNWLEPEGYMFLFEGGPAAPREIEDFFKELAGPSQAEAFWREYREQYITKADIELIRKAGFNSVRVPMHYKLFLTDGEGLRLLDRVVAWCREAGLWVILDLHCAPGGQTGSNIDDSYGYPWLFESAADQETTIGVWARLAKHYQNEPAILGYDLLNEPIPHYPRLQQYNVRLEPLYRRISAAIRKVDTHHVLIFEGAQWGGNFKVFGAPFDRNALYSFHKYWMEPDQKAIQEFVDFRERYDVPVWLGESGENTDEWIEAFVHTLEKNDIGWCFWPYKKMEKTSAPVSIPKPKYWDEITAYAKVPGNTGAAESRIAARPTLEHSQEALKDLLRKIRLEHCRINAGYLKALGLHAGDAPISVSTPAQ